MILFSISLFQHVRTVEDRCICSLSLERESSYPYKILGDLCEPLLAFVLHKSGVINKQIGLQLLFKSRNLQYAGFYYIIPGPVHKMFIYLS